MHLCKWDDFNCWHRNGSTRAVRNNRRHSTVPHFFKIKMVLAVALVVASFISLTDIFFRTAVFFFPRFQCCDDSENAPSSHSRVSENTEKGKMLNGTIELLFRMSAAGRYFQLSRNRLHRPRDEYWQEFGIFLARETENTWGWYTSFVFIRQTPATTQFQNKYAQMKYCVLSNCYARKERSWEISRVNGVPD